MEKRRFLHAKERAFGVREFFFLFLFIFEEKVYLFICLNKTGNGGKFGGTELLFSMFFFLLMAMITTSYLFFLFVMVSKLNDLPTNLCCNSETCLPTNKRLIWIYLSALTKVLLFGPGFGTLLYN